MLTRWEGPTLWRVGRSFPLRDVPQEAGPEYVQIYEGASPKNKPVRLICFYLPQFHPIPENDEWWGEGFTEWTNVRPALPQFEGHYQPRLPGELGYYNLLDPDVQARQVELAKLYGIEGFCFYFYWFGGKRLLEAPILNYLKNENLDLPFCLCWANENWSRRWDGLDSEILIAQSHSSADDIAFIAHVAEYMRDRRCIRIAGKPLLMVYRPSLLPDAKATAKRWRDWCRENGIGEIFLAYTQSFEAVSPTNYGFDAAIEFPPNNSSPPNITESVVPLQEDFGVTVYDWKVFVERSERYTNPGYEVFRSVCPSWDNTPRRRNFSTVFKNSDPALYRRWLENAINDTIAGHQDPSERLVFVNAWNEWAEGAHLEPDARHGYAYLQATRNALEAVAATMPKNGRLVLVSHDAYPHGAQFLTLNLARTLSKEFGVGVELVCLGEGPLKAEYAKWATVHDLAGVDPRGTQATALAERLRSSGIRAALVNTTVSGFFLETLSKAGFRCVSLIHELSGVLEQMNLIPQARAIAEFADRIVFPAEQVATSFRSKADYKDAKRIIRPQGLYKRRSPDADREVDRHELRKLLSLPQTRKSYSGLDMQIIARELIYLWRPD
ncbi:MAG: glycoside hydrolase family 99-like domain-containing protein [Sulfuritalea sp.]|nr:glycoside hydrolase family 99-like domain-containing protein [Sulfuritalea sp.]